MPASTLITFNDLAEQIGKGVHNWATATLKVALTNTTPNDATNTVLADITQIAATGGYTAGAGGGYAVASITFNEAAGVATLLFADLVITATGGSVGPFRYAVLYNDSATSPADALIGYLDYGSALTLADTETLTIDLGASGILQVTA
jgi:hypothetical protein